MNPNLILIGSSCSFIKDDMKTKEINRGALLIPYNGDKSIMLDRFDCRGFLDDLKKYEGYISRESEIYEEMNIEQSYDYDRYYDLFHNIQRSNDVDKSSAEVSSAVASSSNTTINGYNAVGFDYVTQAEAVEEAKSAENEEAEKVSDSEDDLPYICPADLKLKLPTATVLPETERKAAIIEQTARFVAERGPQLEILIRTKQARNRRFDFLHYDHRLNAFYRHVTQLIKCAQYIPSRRHASHIMRQDPTSKKEGPDIAVPKIDISSTPYGKLVERFKQSQERKRIEQESKAEKEIESALTDKVGSNKREHSRESSINADSQKQPGTESRCHSPSSMEMVEARQKMYEDLYQKYYPHYYQYYNDVYGSVESVEKISGLARDYAANSAANWIHANMPDPSAKIETDENEIAVMRKMAEYVALKGPEFEEMMRASQNGHRFAFLNAEHGLHKRYRRLLRREKQRLQPQEQQPPPPKEKDQLKKRRKRRRSRRSSSGGGAEQPALIACIVDSYGVASDDENGSSRSSSSSSRSSSNSKEKIHKSVSFRVAKVSVSAITTASSVLPLTTTTATPDEDDYDFTDRLFSRSSKQTSTGNGSSSAHRVSRFSPANPKNIIAISAQNFDAQMSRKRRAAEMVASKLITAKTAKPSTDEIRQKK